MKMIKLSLYAKQIHPLSKNFNQLQNLYKMKYLIFALLFVACAFSAKSQENNENFWELLPTPEGVSFDDIEHIVGNIIAASSRDSGLYISYNNGDAWEKSSFEYGCFEIEAGPNGYVYAERYPGRFLLYSDDTCKTWNEGGQFLGSWPLSIHVVDNDVIYVGGSNSVWRSLDTCKTWQELMQNNNVGYTSYVNSNPITGAVYATFRIIEAGDQGLYGSLTGDSGTWVPKNMPDDWLTCVEFDHEGNIYLGSRENMQTGFCGLYKNVGNDYTWEIMTGTVEPVMQIVPLINGDMYLSCPVTWGSGAMYFYNYLENEFSIFESELSTSNINPLKVINNHLFACNITSDLIYRSVEPVTDIGISKKNLPVRKSITYPNPAYKGENIMICLANCEYKSCQFSIYDMKGSRLLYKEIQNKQKASFPTEQLQKGLYIIEIRQENNIYTDKIIIL